MSDKEEKDRAILAEIIIGGMSYLEVQQYAINAMYEELENPTLFETMTEMYNYER